MYRPHGACQGSSRLGAVAVRRYITATGDHVADRSWLYTFASVGAVAGAVWWWSAQNPSSGGASEDNASLTRTRAQSCGSLSGEVADRVTRCLAELPKVSLAPKATDVLNSLDKGSVLVIGDQLDITPPQILFSGETELQAMALTTNEGTFAKTLREKGIRAVVVHRDLTAAVDRDGTVLSRLAQHDFLEWFQLRYVAPDVFIYTVRGEATRISQATGEQLLAGLRARLEGRTAPKQSWNPSDVRLIGSIRLQGQTLALRHTVGKNIESSLDDLADKLKRRWDRDVEVMGFGPLKDNLPKARIEIHVVLERAPVEARDRFSLFDLYELGVDGAMLTGKSGDDELFAFMPGSEAVARSFKSADLFLQFAAKDGGFRDRRPWVDSKVALDITRDEHYMERLPGGGSAVHMYRGMPIVSMDSITDENVRDMLVAGGEWWLRNQYDDGSFVYKYWPEQNRYSTEYNEVRHILAARDLSDTWRYRHDPRYLEGAKRSMDWLMAFAIDANDPQSDGMPHPPANSMLFRYPKAGAAKPPNQKLGTVAVALLGWLEWAKATGSREEDDHIREMATFVQSMQDSTGRFEPYYVPQGHPYYGNRNDIVPGEAALALGNVAEYFNEPQWMSFFPKFLDFYEPWFRERAVKKNQYGRWPHATYDNQTRLDLVQFGPWSVMASKQYYHLTGDERAAKFGLEVADWMIDNYQWTEKRSPFPDYVGGYYKMPEELPAMQTFCYSEGTAAAYTIASKFAPDRKDKYDSSTREAIRFLSLMQYDEVDTYAAPRPVLINGGIKYAMNEGKIRIDYVGHGLSTLSQYLDARAADPAVKFTLVPLEVTDTAGLVHNDLPGQAGEDGDNESDNEGSD